MKNLLTVLALVISSTSFAGVADLSWSDLIAKDQAYQIDIRWPRAAAGLAINKLCVAGDTLKTINAETLCTDTQNVAKPVVVGHHGEQTPPEWVCVAKETKVWQFSRSYTESRCLEYQPREGKTGGVECKTYGPVAMSYPIENNVEIYTVGAGSHNGGPALLGTKGFTIPACQ